jgi:hypothetical protein
MLGFRPPGGENLQKLVLQKDYSIKENYYISILSRSHALLASRVDYYCRIPQ